MIRAQHAIDFLPAKFRDRPARDNYPREVRSFHRSIARNRHTPSRYPFPAVTRDMKKTNARSTLRWSQLFRLRETRERESGGEIQGRNNLAGLREGIKSRTGESSVRALLFNDRQPFSMSGTYEWA